MISKDVQVDFSDLEKEKLSIEVTGWGQLTPKRYSSKTCLSKRMNIQGKTCHFFRCSSKTLPRCRSSAGTKTNTYLKQSIVNINKATKGNPYERSVEAFQFPAHKGSRPITNPAKKRLLCQLRLRSRQLEKSVSEQKLKRPNTAQNRKRMIIDLYECNSKRS